MKHTVSSLSPFEISKGFNARMIHTVNMTLAYVDVDEGAGGFQERECGVCETVIFWLSTQKQIKWLF
jgi:hypothetical protein